MPGAAVLRPSTTLGSCENRFLKKGKQQHVRRRMLWAREGAGLAEALAHRDQDDLIARLAAGPGGGGAQSKPRGSEVRGSSVGGSLY
jgi:hypothetical protein